MSVIAPLRQIEPRPRQEVALVTSPSAVVHVVDDDVSFQTSDQPNSCAPLADVVETYASAEELLKRPPKAGEPGCILLDINMPGVSGPDLQARLNGADRACPSSS